MMKMKAYTKSRTEFVAVSEEKVTAREFLQIKSTKAGDIKSVKFVAPKIGSKDFGSFSVEYRTPKLVPIG